MKSKLFMSFFVASQIGLSVSAFADPGDHDYGARTGQNGKTHGEGLQTPAPGSDSWRKTARTHPVDSINLPSSIPLSKPAHPLKVASVDGYTDQEVDAVLKSSTPRAICDAQKNEKALLWAANQLIVEKKINFQILPLNVSEEAAQKTVDRARELLASAPADVRELLKNAVDYGEVTTLEIETINEYLQNEGSELGKVLTFKFTTDQSRDLRSTPVLLMPNSTGGVSEKFAYFRSSGETLWSDLQHHLSAVDAVVAKKYFKQHPGLLRKKLASPEGKEASKNFSSSVCKTVYLTARQSFKRGETQAVAAHAEAIDIEFAEKLSLPSYDGATTAPASNDPSVSAPAVERTPIY